MSDATKIKMLAKLRTMSVDRKTNDRKCESAMKIHEVCNEGCRKEDKWHTTKSEQKEMSTTNAVQTNVHCNKCQIENDLVCNDCEFEIIVQWESDN